MKTKSGSAPSEAELLKAMIRTGRTVSRQTLSHWRSTGLLPRLSNKGRGQGQGRDYYWTQDNIFAHACYLHDLTKAYRAHDTIVALWLSGFQIEFQQFRRAWLHRMGQNCSSKSQLSSKPNAQICLNSKQAVRKGAVALEPDHSGIGPFINLMLGVSGFLASKYAAESSIQLTQVIAAVVRKLNLDESARKYSSGLWMESLFLFESLASAIEKSELFKMAPESELFKARQHVCVLGRLYKLCSHLGVSRSTSRAPFWTPPLAVEAAPSLFLYVLALTSMGFSHQLDATAAEINSLCDQLLGVAKGSCEEEMQIAQFKRQCVQIWPEFTQTRGSNSKGLSRQSVKHVALTGPH